MAWVSKMKIAPKVKHLVLCFFLNKKIKPTHPATQGFRLWPHLFPNRVADIEKVEVGGFLNFDRRAQNARSTLDQEVNIKTHLALKI